MIGIAMRMGDEGGVADGKSKVENRQRFGSGPGEEYVGGRMRERYI